MLQFYFLSILANVLAGVALASEYLAGRFPVFVPFRELLSRRAWQASLGVLAAAVGFLKLLIRSSAADVPVVGDLIPALLGMAMGASLLLHVVRERSDLPAMGRLERAALAYRGTVPLGLAPQRGPVPLSPYSFSASLAALAAAITLSATFPAIGL
jgi:hypothetical protein